MGQRPVGEAPAPLLDHRGEAEAPGGVRQAQDGPQAEAPVVGGGVANPDEALIIANRARELGFSSTVGVIHDGDGLNKGLTDREKEVYKEIKSKGTRSYARWNWFQDKLVEGEEYDWRCRAGARYLYIDELGTVNWCSQQRGTPGIPLLEYTHEDMEREYITEKWCAPTCTIQCVHQVGHRGPDEVAISHLTALSAYGISDANPDRIHITVPKSTRLRRQQPTKVYGREFMSVAALSTPCRIRRSACDVRTWCR